MIPEIPLPTNTTPAVCTDDWCATCGHINEDAQHIYGCDCPCNLYAQEEARTPPQGKVNESR